MKLACIIVIYWDIVVTIHLRSELQGISMHSVDTYVKIPHACKLTVLSLILNHQGEKFLLELLVIEETEKENLKEK